MGAPQFGYLLLSAIVGQAADYNYTERPVPAPEVERMAGRCRYKRPIANVTIRP